MLLWAVVLAVWACAAVLLVWGCAVATFAWWTVVISGVLVCFTVAFRSVRRSLRRALLRVLRVGGACGCGVLCWALRRVRTL